MVSFIAYYNLFQEAIKFDRLIQWIKSIKNVNSEQIEEIKKELFPGLHLILISLWTGLIQKLNDEEVFDLDYDKYYIRSFHYVELKIKEIPITCERTAFIIGLLNLGKKLRKAKNYHQLDEGIEQVRPFLNDLKNVIDSKATYSGVDKTNAIKILNIYTLFNDFHNLQRNLPPCLRNTLFNGDIAAEYMLKCYYGFFYTINYIWIQILDKNELIITSLDKLYLFSEFIKSALKSKKKLFLFLKSVEEFTNYRSKENKDFYKDNAKNILEGKKIINQFSTQISQQFKFQKISLYKYLRNLNKLPPFLKILEDSGHFKKVDDSKPSKKLDHFEKIKYSLKINKDEKDSHIDLFIDYIWQIFDNFYPIISQFIDEKNYQKLIPPLFPTEIVFLKTKQNKDAVKNYLVDYSVVSLPRKDQKKREFFDFLDLKFFWYELDVLESHRSFFNGFAACKSIILGEVYFRMLNKIKEKLYVKIFKHSGGKTGSITFAILVEGYGTVSSDFSGWLVFYNAANYGYPGFGPDLYKYILKILDENNEHVNYEQIPIDSSIFLEYLGDHQVERNIQEFNLTNQVIEENESLKNKIEQYNGIIFESLVYKWLINNNEYQYVKWNEKLRGNQIDLMVFYKDKNKIDIIECKMNLHLDTLKDIRQNILTKKRVTEKEFMLYEIESILVIFNFINEERKKYFESKQIKVIDNFKDIITKNRKFFGKNIFTDYFISV
ncbi:MAG: hypothetical protein HWN80_18070 [Candidatus Lokiarchaeota archaeon]|nr:hypothetical protein [Candidatus Lokiarchaeota archaeon]